MSIQSFVDQIPPVILSRARSYVHDGSILDITAGDSGEWTAEIEGNYGIYNVIIETDEEGEVDYYSCDCPFEGDLCKHVGAVALTILENEEIMDLEPEENNWKELIKAAKLEELKTFMLDFGKQNRDFRHQIKLAFTKPTVDNKSSIAYYQQQIKGIFDHYGYHGFMDYRSSRNASNDVYEFIKKAENYLSKGFLNEAFRISAAIVMEGVEGIQEMDDSSGEMGGAMQESFRLIKAVFQETESSNLKGEVFDWLQEQVKNDDYSDYGVGDPLLPLFIESAIALKHTTPAYEYLEQKIKKLSTYQSDWDRKYYSELYLKYKIDLLQAEGRMDEADLVIDTNLHLEDLRKMRVKQVLADGDIATAVKLILEGIELAKKDNYPGTVHQWKDQLLGLYHEHEMIERYNALAKELFLENSSSMDYFRVYKKTSPEEEWDSRRNNLIAQLKKKEGNYYRYHSDALANVYLEENMIDELFEIVTGANSMHTLIRYTKYLKEKYSSELLEYYKAAIEIAAEQSGRSVYQALVGYLKEMAKLKGGKVAAKQLKDSLLDRYKNRPAMKEEFKKLNWD